MVEESTTPVGFRVDVPMTPGGAVTVTSDAFASESGVTISVLGEIYGSSPESVLRSYMNSGVEAVSSAQGSFLVVVEDRRTDQLWLVTDHVGSRSAYLWELGDRRLVTNTLKSGPRHDFEPDAGGVGSYLSSDGVRAGLTPYRGVSALPPGSVMDLRADNEPRRYWTIPIQPEPNSASVDEYADEMIRLMRTAVKKRLASVADAPVALSLSGGVDSRGLLGLLAETIGPDRIQAFTYHHGASVGDMDLPEARAAASEAGAKHFVLPGYRGDFVGSLLENAVRGDSVAHFCDDVDVWAQASSFLAEGSALVVGDRQSHHWGRMPDDLPTDALLRLVSLYKATGIEWFLARLPEDAGRSIAEEWERRYEEVAEALAALGSWRLATHRAYLEQRTYPTLTLWRERFCRQVGPVLSPYLDRDLLEFVGRLPVRFNDADGSLMHRIALERAFPGLLTRPHAHGGWNIPDWGAEIARYSSELVALVKRVDSAIESLVPKETTIALLGEVAESPSTVTTATSGWRGQLRRAVKRSPTVRGLVRNRRLQHRRVADPVVSRVRLLRRLLTLHLAMADPSQIQEIQDGRDG